MSDWIPSPVRILSPSKIEINFIIECPSFNVKETVSCSPWVARSRTWFTTRSNLVGTRHDRKSTVFKFSSEFLICSSSLPSSLARCRTMCCFSLSYLMRRVSMNLTINGSFLTALEILSSLRFARTVARTVLCRSRAYQSKTLEFLKRDPFGWSL
jgi:hypothetical protein